MLMIMDMQGLQIVEIKNILLFTYQILVLEMESSLSISLLD